jgi:hypothetical protein
MTLIRKNGATLGFTPPVSVQLRSNSRARESTRDILNLYLKRLSRGDSIQCRMRDNKHSTVDAPTS